MEKLFDASAYMLFEASGDSDQAVTAEEYSGGADDDAESCSYGSLSGTKRVQVCEDEFNGVDYDECDRTVEDEEGVNNEEEEEEEEGVVEQCRGGGKEEEESKDVKVINERENDRLFWEGCLAS